MHISALAVLVAVIANFIFGSLWYMPLFGKAWAKEMGFDPNGPKPATSVMVKGMTFMVIGNFLMAWVLAHNMAAWNFVPGVKEMGALSNTISAGVFTWVGFYLPVDLGGVAWSKHSWKLFGINTGYHLIMTLIAAGILAYMA